MMNDAQTGKKVRAAQRGEITEHFIYRKLAESTKSTQNKDILLRISSDEMRHYSLWKEYTKRAEKPNWIRVWAYYLVSRVFGLTFGIKLMERGEGEAQTMYRRISRSFPQALDIAKEDEHEEQLIQMIDPAPLYAATKSSKRKAKIDFPSCCGDQRRTVPDVVSNRAVNLSPIAYLL